MRKLYFLVFILYAALLPAGCGSDGDKPAPPAVITIEAGSASISLPSTTTGSATVKFTTSESWQVTTSDTRAVPDWFRVSPTSGGAGEHTLTVSLSKGNTGYDDRTGYIYITSGDKRETVTVTQKQKDAIIIDEKSFEFDISGGSLDIFVEHNVELSVSVEGSAGNWIERVGTRALETTTLYFDVAACDPGEQRSGTITVSQGNIVQRINVSQLGYYASTDYSYDGKVTTLQAATVGNGINIVLMGDGYTDRWFADNRYENKMRQVMENFFTIEPYATYRDCFNVYMVNVVSKHEVFETSPKSTTALECYYGDKGNSTHVDGNKNKCQTYAQKAITTNQLHDAVLVIIMNEDYYAGTCYFADPPYNSPGDYGRGLSICFFPDASGNVFEQLLHHEAGGHGFAKLADEYYHDGRMPEGEIAGYKASAEWGWSRNIDFTNNISEVKWARFIQDFRYSSENLGAYEGAGTYQYGAFRPTLTSIMDNNRGGFNAPSREAIYIRINKLAYGESWEYDYETFVAYDQSPAVAGARRGVYARPAAAGASGVLLPPTPPVRMGNAFEIR